MIINPIIPIWLMTIICLLIIALIIYNSQLRKINNNKVDNEKTSRQ